MFRRSRFTGALLAPLLLAACGQEGGSFAEGVVFRDESVNVELLEPAVAASADAPPIQSAEPTPQAAPQIAYSYRYALEIPADRAPGLMNRHEQACVAAGTGVCQVIGARSDRQGRDALSARLEVRATPAYIARLRATLAEDVKGAGGRIASEATDSEDLTRSLSDTTARLNALTTLRDRLQQLLATRSGPLDQLLQVERELARVQGELDATRSALETMRTRVATSRLTIDYHAAGRLAPDSAFRPVTEALSGALGVFMTTLGALILIVAGLAPIALIAAPLVWLFLRRRRAKTAAGATPPMEPGGS